MNRTSTMSMTLAALGLAAGTATAQDQSLISFGFTNMIVEDISFGGNGEGGPGDEFNGTTIFGSARSDFTFGGVSLSGYENGAPVPPSEQADFNVGTTGEPASPADAFFSLSVDFDTGFDEGPLQAEAFGSFTIVDADGDTLEMTFEGLVLFDAESDENFPLFLDALLTDIEFTAVGGDEGDGTFDGPSGGSFAYDSLIPVIPAFNPDGGFGEGAVPSIQITLFDLQENLGGVALAQGSFVTIPAPGVAGAFGLAGLAAVRRRR